MQPPAADIHQPAGRRIAPRLPRLAPALPEPPGRQQSCGARADNPANLQRHRQHLRHGSLLFGRSIKYIDVLNTQVDIFGMTESATKPSRRGVPKGDKRQRTRARLIAAAAEVIGEKGFERTSLEEVAARAGMTRGAIYGNFQSKDELLLAFVETRWRPVSAAFRRGAGLREQMGLLGAAVAEAADARRSQAAGMLSFMLYAVTHEPIRRQLAARNAEVYARMEPAMAGYFDPAELPMSPAAFVRVLHAMSDGFVIARFLQPEVFTRELIVAAFEALAA
ncbi:MAG: TetR/AcrR family transcriptional regulator [Phenylobacterium sp.]|nr:MAG: TetR/AcrR family transcriptional regulator [Phenylobacterium sp.]